MSGARAYVRPIPCRRDRSGALPLAGTGLGFAEVEVLRRNAPPQVLPAEAACALFPEAAESVAAASAPRAPVAGLTLDRARVMGVLNVTPDSFSDGGRHRNIGDAVAHGLRMVAEGADILDIGGESTRPGAETVPEQQEIDRILPVIEALVAAGCPAPISVDTRKAGVARAALAAGARMLNDVSAMLHDPCIRKPALGAEALCLMHAQGDPRTMQDDPRYSDVLLDVYEFLETRVCAALGAGIPRDRILVDPGIGFGKTLVHNLALLRRLSLFHALGCPVLLGVSRKRFIGTLGGEPQADRRAPGSIAANLAGLTEGAQILRVHDVAETVQAVRVWQAITTGEGA